MIALWIAFALLLVPALWLLVLPRLWLLRPSLLPLPEDMDLQRPEEAAPSSAALAP